MLSRIAENFYWMARYLERAEDTARLMGVYSNLQLEIPARVRGGWDPIVLALGFGDARPKKNRAPIDERAAVKLLFTSPDTPGSILKSLYHARECARTMREITPREAWESINVLYQNTRDTAQTIRGRRARPDELYAVVRGVQQMHGLLDATMLHDEGMRFHEIGTALERADMTTRIIDAAASVASEQDATADLTTVRWMGVLKSVSGFQMYLRRTNGTVEPQMALRFLLKDEIFPRSVCFCLDVMLDRLRGLRNSEPVIERVAFVRERVVKRRIGVRPDEGLGAFLDRLQGRFIRVDRAISKAYFRTK